MNLFEGASPAPGEEISDKLFENREIRVFKTVSNCAQTGWYDQDEDELVFLLEGEAELLYEDRAELLQKGEQVFIPAHIKHKVAKTSENCVWLLIFFKQTGGREI